MYGLCQEQSIIKTWSLITRILYVTHNAISLFVIQNVGYFANIVLKNNTISFIDLNLNEQI
jgi:hypothetical protein